MHSNRSWRQRAGLLFAACLFASMAAVIAPAGAAHADTPCQDGGVYLVFARGSGASLGSIEADTFSTSVRNQLTAMGLSSTFAEVGDLDGNGSVGLGDYPALYGLGWVVFPTYAGSVDWGVTELVNHLNNRVTRPGCQREAIVLAGFSQGADVVGAAMQDPRLHAEVLNHIAYMATYGDPRHNTGSFFGCLVQKPVWVKGDAGCNLSDGAPVESRYPYVRPGFENKTGSWCALNDGICSHNVLFVPGAHATGAYPNTWIPASASVVAAAAQVKVSELSSSPPSPPAVDPTADRRILHGADGSLWVMAGGAKFYFGSMNEFYGLGYSTSGMVEVSTATLASIPSIPRNGTVLRSGGGQLYTVAGGAKFQFGSMTEYYNQGYANNAWINVPQYPLNQIGDAPGNKPAHGTVIQHPNGSLYVVVGGVKFQFGSMTEYGNLGYSTNQIVRVTEAPTNGIPAASTATPPVNGTVLRSGGGQIYVVAGGAKFHFGSTAEHNGQGYTTGSWFNVPQGSLDAISDAPGHVPGNGTVVLRPDGALFVIAGGVRWQFGSMSEFASEGYTTYTPVSQAPIDGIYDASASHLPANETLIQGTDSTLWVMKLGVRRSFTSMTQFTGMGYSTANIVRVPDGVLSGIPSGGNLP